jgi:hypothetical protein
MDSKDSNKECLELALDAAVINDILDLSKIEAGKLGSNRLNSSSTASLGQRRRNPGSAGRQRRVVSQAS